MKQLFILLLIINIGISREIDSIGVMPLGLDLRNEITIADIVHLFDTPDSIISITNTQFQIHYPNKIFLLSDNKVCLIEIIGGYFRNLKIGMSRRKAQKVFGKTLIIDIFPNDEEIHEYGYYDDRWVRYTVNLNFKNDKLIKIVIRKEDSWL